MLGIDGGGTKTDALLTDNEGNVLVPARWRRIEPPNDSALGAVGRAPAGKSAKERAVLFHRAQAGIVQVRSAANAGTGRCPRYR